MSGPLANAPCVKCAQPLRLHITSLRGEHFEILCPPVVVDPLERAS